MLLLRYRVPKIARHAALSHMNDYDLENQSLWSRLIKLPPVYDRSYRDRNQRTVIVEDVETFSRSQQQFDDLAN
jgi:hypothetical protein